MFGRSEGAVGTFTTRIDDILDYGKPYLLLGVRSLFELRIGKPQVQEKSFVCAGMEPPQEDDFSVTRPLEDFTKNLKFLPTSPKS